MSRSLRQPSGQKKLTNIAAVRLKKQGIRFEIACYPNKVVSWRSGCEKDLDEVLQSQIVFADVSKAKLAKSKDLKAAFGTDDQTKICLEKGKVQVAAKERELQLSNQFRDIATIVMQKTINPETQLPYTITMIERLLHKIHFSIHPHSCSKKQALDVIRELQKKFSIKKSVMRLKLTLPEQNVDSLEGKLGEWKTVIVSRHKSGSQISIVCEMDPDIYPDCDIPELMKNLQGSYDFFENSLHGECNIHADHYDGLKDVSSSSESKEPPVLQQLSEKMQKQKPGNSESEVKQKKCSTCDEIVGDTEQYRQHSKSDWHKHNLKRKTRQLPPLSAQECMADVEMRNDKNEYNF